MDNKISKMSIDKVGNKIWRSSKGTWYRLDGPACEWVDGLKNWYIYDTYLEKEEFNSWILRIQKWPSGRMITWR